MTSHRRILGFRCGIIIEIQNRTRGIAARLCMIHLNKNISCQRNEIRQWRYDRKISKNYLQHFVTETEISQALANYTPVSPIFALMSFIGVSPSDFIALLNGLRRLYKILQKEAVAGFKRHVRIYRNFFNEAYILAELAETDHTQRGVFLRQCIQDTEHLLRGFFTKIEEFRPHLSHRRSTNWIALPKRTFAKIKWALHSKELDGLCRDLEDELNHIFRVSQMTSVTYVPD
jgi:hypothetical protein